MMFRSLVMVVLGVVVPVTGLFAGPPEEKPANAQGLEFYEKENPASPG